jgi:1,2-diacylglycerol 3-beta-glucosyltransferase
MPVSLATVYYLSLSIVALLPRRGICGKFQRPINNFIILIPAHDEENSVGNTIRSCLESEYPLDMFDVWVVADNCTDRTAEVAQSFGAKCLIREDQSRLGKGDALAWGFDRLKSAGNDAFVIVDADCFLDRRALGFIDLHLQEGAEALQVSDTGSNTDDGPTSYMLAVGNLIENHLFYAPKSRLALPVFLRGTGMVLRRTLLERIPWKAQNIAEDLEYSLQLVRAGVRVRFLDQIWVKSRFPVNPLQLDVQRNRWAKGSVGFGKTHALQLMVEGLRNCSVSLFDAGWTLLVLSRPLFLLGLLCAISICLLARWVVPGVASDVLFVTSLILAGINALYFGLGIVLLGLTPSRLRLLLSVPLVLARLTWISLRGLAGVNGMPWVRTPRSL